MNSKNAATGDTGQTKPSGLVVRDAAMAGACVTVLKAFFKEFFLIPNPVPANGNGLTLLPVPRAHD
jgi:hypothetical protein